MVWLGGLQVWGMAATPGWAGGKEGGWRAEGVDERLPLTSVLILRY